MVQTILLAFRWLISMYECDLWANDGIIPVSKWRRLMPSTKSFPFFTCLCHLSSWSFIWYPLISDIYISPFYQVFYIYILRKHRIKDQKMLSSDNNNNGGEKVVVWRQKRKASEWIGDPVLAWSTLGGCWDTLGSGVGQVATKKVNHLKRLNLAVSIFFWSHHHAALLLVGDMGSL
jgi:hypothetical protein